AKWKITTSSSSAASNSHNLSAARTTSSSPAAGNSHDLPAASDKKAFGDGKIVADPSLTVFSFAELKKATKNFLPGALLGGGGFGCVYKGKLHGKQQSGSRKTIIAVKVLNRYGAQGYREWLREINFIVRPFHPNLAKLLGFCQEDKILALVYEFMPMGSLADQLFEKLLTFYAVHYFGTEGSVDHLSWDVRLKIAVGAARGLAFLHSSCNMIHRDFKTTNILLDGSYTAKLSDFGLVRSGPPEGKSHVTTEYVGTFVYTDPVYMTTGHLTIRSDVYSFGLVLLEILTGLPVYHMKRLAGNTNFGEWARPLFSEKKLTTIMDSRLEGKYYADSALQIAQVALICLQREPKQRPSMSKVVEELESIEAA
ncbi:hypothetical protein EUGRSUZ_H04302, partial [Eucalyptus grandis]